MASASASVAVSSSVPVARQLMKSLGVRRAQIAYPTGRKDFAVKQVCEIFLNLKQQGLMQIEGTIVSRPIFTLSFCFISPFCSLFSFQNQAFPGTFTAEEADPFLMMDYFGPMRSAGKIEDPDEFQVAWHPHRGNVDSALSVRM
jgi:hypothetical protein